MTKHIDPLKFNFNMQITDCIIEDSCGYTLIWKQDFIEMLFDSLKFDFIEE